MKLSRKDFDFFQLCVDQHPPSGNDQPNDSGYVSPTDSESDDETHNHMANNQSSAVQLNPDTHELKPQDSQHSTATKPKKRPVFQRDK